MEKNSLNINPDEISKRNIVNQYQYTFKQYHYGIGEQTNSNLSK